MPSLNKVLLIGNVGSDPRLRHTNNSNKAVCNFSLATNEGYGDKQQTEWHSIICWDKLAETMGTHLSKGALILVEGRLQTRKWEKDGVEQKTTEIVAYGITFLSAKLDSEKPAAKPAARPAAPASTQNKPTADEEFLPEDEIPF